MTIWWQEFRFYLGKFWHLLWQDDRHSLQSVIILSCLIISPIIGLRFAGDIYFAGWQILLWLFMIVLTFSFTLPQERHPLHLNRAWLWLVLLLAIAFILRWINLEHFPGAFHIDEAGQAQFSLLHIFPPELGLTINPFRTASDSQPILYFYVLRLFTYLGGYTIAAQRFSSVLTGTFSVAAVYFMVQQFSNKRSAWIAAIIMAGYHYHIHWSRIALNNIWVTLFIPLILAFFVWGWKEKRNIGSILSGLLIGLSIYFYQGGILVLFLILFVYIDLHRKSDNRFSLTMYSIRAVVVAWVVAAPMIAFAILYPQDYGSRANVIFGWHAATIAMEMGATNLWLKYAWLQFIHSFGAYNFFVDSTGFYAPQVPLLIGVASPLFLVGFLWSIVKKQWLPVLWVLLVTILGGFLLSAPPGSSHYVVVIPAICWLLAIIIDQLFTLKYRGWAYFLLIAIVLTDLIFYFVIYQSRPSLDFSIPFPIVPPFN